MTAKTPILLGKFYDRCEESIICMRHRFRFACVRELDEKLVYDVSLTEQTKTVK